MKNFGEKVRELRVLSGLTQVELGKLVGIHPSHLSRIEGGDKNPPKRQTVGKLCDGLGLDRTQRKSLFESAGYSPPPEDDALGYSSPLTDTGEPEVKNLGEQISQLRGLAKIAIVDLLDLLSIRDLRPSERRSLARQSITLTKALRLSLEEERKKKEE